MEVAGKASRRLVRAVLRGKLNMYAWAGRILHVDLEKKKIWKEDLSQKQAFEFVGGRGVNAKLLWDLIKKPGIDSFSPDNVLIFGTGTLTGTTAPSSGRTTITCKGALTNLYLKTNMGGHWGAEVKYAGYDHVVFYQRSAKPVYLWINDDQVELRDAKHLWGMNVRETDQAIKSDNGEPDAKVACIGPAGENLVRFASVMNSVYNAAGRGGAGAVMGSKNLKAIGAKGSGELKLAEPDRFKELAFVARVDLSKDPEGIKLYKTGTAGGMEVINESGALPSYNFKIGKVDSVYPLSGECLVEEGYLDRRVGCFSCTISCHRYCSVKSGPYAGASSGGPEYETSASLGSGTGNFDTGVIIKGGELCNKLGLDTISTGVTIQWAMESYERGVLGKDDTDGIELKFGNPDALIATIENIAYRKGKLGDLLAEGTMRASRKVGKESWKWAIHNSKGLEQSDVETRSAKGYALAFAVNPRGPDHLHTEVLAEFGGTPTRLALVKKITGDEKWANSHLTEYRAELVRYHEDVYAVTDSMGFCAFTSTAAYAVNPKNMAEMFTAATGMRVGEQEMMMAGRRIVTLEKCFNIREGIDRKHDDLPWRLMNEPASPATEGEVLMNSREELDGMLDKYYALHEWDGKTSWPYKKTLLKVGLKDVADELGRMNRLPK
jgi:aldehyde:ferredoxin oxidoreductase